MIILNQATILIVDDEINTLKVLSAILSKKGYEVITSHSAEDALSKLNNANVDTIIVDYKLPNMSGIDFVEIVKRDASSPPIIMLTAFGSIEKAVEAMKKGAFNYLTKPVNKDELLTVIREALDKQRLIQENKALKSIIRERHSFQNIIGKSRVMQDLFNMIAVVSKSNSNVLITGESGTGKELVAKAIHYESSRADKPFIPIDCATLPAELIESELFGHEKGSFTGAYDKKIGQIELADGGTVFLDEISELPLPLQKKFLRFLQEKEIMRVGGSKRINVDVRVVSATNRDLQEEVNKGNFREDLFYRLNVVTLRIPPLRDRKEDIPLLVEHFLNKFNKVNNKHISSIDTDVMQALMQYNWKGNVRELENTIERAVVLCPSDTITLRYLPSGIRDMVSDTQQATYGLNLLHTEKMLIVKALEQSSYNQTKAAEILGISRKQLRTKMKHHGLLSSSEDTLE
ncbi:MAG: sigma-54 dependent transcriptional regulator [Thermodesulfovibrionales bacterium]|nr:sigma-54 dependent transcriptional regulator [Thermodesulfovibrionales bacterium]